METLVFEPEEWTFDADSQGWRPDNDLTDFAATAGILAMQSTSDDPYMLATGLRLSPQFATVTITMAVEGGDNFGELFFVTENDRYFGEDKILGFEVVGDGEMHSYELDFNSLAAWSGAITGLRFDPVTTADTRIEIDSISFGD